MQQDNFAANFILEFTQELIRNSIKKQQESKEQILIQEPIEIRQLENINKKPKTYQKLPQNNIQQKPIETSPTEIKQTPTTQRLTIPKENLPQRFQDIQPTPTKIEIELGKLNKILENPYVQSVECNGPNKEIKTLTKRGKTTTNIQLSKEEIDQIIQTFSSITKIPTTEGVYKVAAGNLILLAVISDVLGTKFVIRKISNRETTERQIPRRPMPPQMRRPPMRMPMRR